MTSVVLRNIKYTKNTKQRAMKRERYGEEMFQEIVAQFDNNHSSTSLTVQQIPTKVSSETQGQLEN